MKSIIHGNERGSMLVESLIALAILLVAVTALIPIFVLSTNSTNMNHSRTVAYNTAANELERIKSVAYDSVGLSGGNPSGVLAANSTKTVNGITYNITTDVDWIDNPDDGLFPTDVDGRDYKKVIVTISWTDSLGAKTLALNTAIARESEDQAAAGGNLKVTVVDGEGTPINGVTVNITAGPPAQSGNNTVSAPVSDLTDENGETLFYTLTPSEDTDDYTVSVSKLGYVVIPGQEHQHTTITVRQTQNMQFVLERAGTLIVRLVDSDGDIIEVPSQITIQHASIGAIVLQNPSNGQFQKSDLYPGIWVVTPVVATYETTQTPAADVQSNQTEIITIPMQQKALCTVNFTVTNATGGAVIEAAQISMLSTDTVNNYSAETGAQGTATLQVNPKGYNITVTKSGFTTHTQAVTAVAPGPLNLSIQLTPTPGSIRVHCEYEHGGDPKSGVKIKVTNASIDYSREITTGSDGNALFDNLTPGTYRIQRWKSSEWRDATNRNVTAGVQSSKTWDDYH